MNGKNVKRMDHSLNLLLNLVYNMMSDRLINVEKGVISTRIQKIRVSHNKSQQMDVTITPWSEEECWIVQSENKESIGYYELRILDRNCRCKLRCDKCNICIHYYSCTCHDYLIRSNLCKHKVCPLNTLEIFKINPLALVARLKFLFLHIIKPLLFSPN